MARPIRSHIRELLHLAIPIIGAQLAQIAMGFIDTIMLGRLSSEALAAGALGNAVYFPITIVAVGFLQSVGPHVSQAFGAGASGEIRRYVQQGLYLALGLSLLVIPLLWHPEPLFRLTGQHQHLTAEARAYLRALSTGVVANLSFAVLRQFVEGISRPRIITVITLGGVLLNVVGDYVLMFGKAGFPALGVVGTGMATAIVYWSMLLAIVVYIRRARFLRIYRALLDWEPPHPATIAALIRVGWPIGLLFGVEAGLFSATTLLMGRFGAQALAAHQIALQTAATTFMVPLGIGIATSIRVGQCLGAGRLTDMRRAGFVGMAAGATFMTCMGLFLLLFPDGIITLYTGHTAPETVRALARNLLYIAAAFQIFDGIQVTASGALRGLKDTFVPLLLGAFAYWGMGFPLAWLLGNTLGPEGLWWGLVGGLATAAVLLSLRFHLRSLDLLRQYAHHRREAVVTTTVAGKR